MEPTERTEDCLSHLSAEPADTAKLSDDDLQSCLGQLDQESLCSATAVSKRWCRLAKDRTVWRQLLCRCFPGLTAAIGMHERELIKKLYASRQPRQPTRPQDVVVILELRVDGKGSGRNGPPPSCMVVRTFELAALKQTALPVTYEHDTPQCVYQLPLEKSEFESVRRVAERCATTGGPLYGKHTVAITLLRKRDGKTVRVVADPTITRTHGASLTWSGNLSPLNATHWGAGRPAGGMSWARQAACRPDTGGDFIDQTVEVDLDVGIPCMCSIGEGGLQPQEEGLHPLGETAHALFDANALFLKISVNRCREFESNWTDDEDEEGEQKRLWVEPTEMDTRLTQLDKFLLSELPWS